MPELAPLSLGPFVLSGERALAALAIAAALIVVEIVGRRRGHAVDWAWTAVLVGLAAARVGWIVTHPAAYLARPHEVLYVWQGGFASWAGVAGGFAWAWWRSSRSGLPATTLAVPSLAAGVVTVLALVVLPAPPEQLSLQAWDVTVERLDGAPGAVADWSGTPTVVNLWATWCPPCRRELPMLVDLVGGRSDVRLALVSQGEPASLVAAYLRDEGLPTDDAWTDLPRALGSAVSLSGYPTTLFVAADGSVREVQVGELSRATLLRGLAEIGVAARQAGLP